MQAYRAIPLEHRSLTTMPEPSALLWETPFWLAILLCALVPGSLAPWLNWAGIPVRASEASIAGVALLYGLLVLPTGRAFAAAILRSPAFPILIAIGYGVLTLLMSPLASDDRTAMLCTLVFAAAPPILAMSLLHGKRADDLRFFLWRLTVFVAGVSLIYVAESLFSLGLRSELGQNIPLDFGMERVRGPLYGAATGYMALFPAAGFAMHETIEGKSGRWISVTLVVVLMTALLGLGSRAAVLMLVPYLVLLTLLTRGRAKRLISIFLLLFVAVVSGALIFARATTDRLQHLQDPLREATHSVAWRMITQQPLSESLIGSGYGAVWSWYMRDATYGERLAAGDSLIRTPYGPALYHSHSTALEMIVELGLPGAICLAGLIIWLAQQLIASRRLGQFQALACGIATTGMGLFFDLFLFKNTTVNLIWWLYAIGLYLLLRQRESDRCASS